MAAKRKRSTENESELFIPRMQALSEALSDGSVDKAPFAVMVERAAQLLENNYYEAALAESQRVLQVLQKDVHSALVHRLDMASASVLRGRALLKALTTKLAHEGEEEDAIMRTLCEARAAFSLALMMHSDNSEAKVQLEEVQSLAIEVFGEEGPEKLKSVIPEPQLQTINAPIEKASSDQGAEGVQPAESAALINEPNVADVKPGPELDIIIVGAGASGVGVAAQLVSQFGISRDRMLLLERGPHVGASFRLWPKEMRFISPSFNQHGWTSSFDLNSIAVGTSPASFTFEEHPTGEQYARYLETLALGDFQLPIQFGTDVTAICPVGSAGDPLFEVHVTQPDKAHEKENGSDSGKSVLRSRFVVWAAGEFQYPKRSGLFPGAELCRHNSTVRSWVTHPGGEFVVIGGYESGIDAAVNLVASDRPVTVLASSPCWEESSRDPSGELAPHTRARLKRLLTSQDSDKLQLHGGLRVKKVEFINGKYSVHASQQPSYTGQTDAKDHSNLHEEVSVPRVFVTSSPPILSVGFEGSVANLVKHLFDWGEHEAADPKEAARKPIADSDEVSGPPRLTEEDESTRTEGLFLSGPMVSHEGLVFCFVYKFRQRFAVVAAAVASRLGTDTHMGVLTCRSADMFLDDFVGVHACCGDPQ